MGAPVRPEPQNTLDEEFERWKQQQPSSEQQPGQLDESFLGQAANRIRMGAQGLTFGFADEAAGALDAGLNKLSGGRFGRPYDESVEANRARDDAFREAHPVQALSSEVLGGIAMPAGILGKLAQQAKPAATLGRQVARGMGAGAATGAVTGAVAGAGYGEGSPLERVDDAAAGAAFGTGFGALAGGAIPVAARVGRSALDLLRMRPEGAPLPSGGMGAQPPFSQASGPRTGAVGAIPESGVIASNRERGADKILEALERDNKSIDDLGQEFGQRMARPKPETLLEYGGENVQSLGEAVASMPGRGQQVMAETVKRRIGEPFSRNQPMRSRIKSDIETRYGLPAGSTSEASATISKNMQKEARPLYDAAYQHPPITDDIITEALSLPEFQAAYEAGRKLARIERVALPEIDEALKSGMPVQGLDYMKRGLDAVIERGGESGKAMDRGTARALRGRLNEVLRRVDEIVPAYGEARAKWAGESALKDALEEGSEAASNTKLTAADIGAALAEKTASERRMYAQGYINSLVDAPDAAGWGHNPSRKIAASPAVAEKLDAVFGNKSATDDLLTDLSREDRMFGAKNRQLGNSSTARRGAAQQDLASAPSSQQVRSSRPQSFFDAASRPFWWGLDKVRARQMEGTAGTIAELLSLGSENPDDFQLLMQELARAQQRTQRSAGRQVGGAAAAGTVSGQQGGRR